MEFLSTGIFSHIWEGLSRRVVIKHLPYLFPSSTTGKMYHPDSVVRLHEKILRDAGLPHIRFHDLRHTFATMALQNGVDIKTVSAMLGHYDAGFIHTCHPAKAG